tara:strand:+ start:425 stop:733 length:309 start_codon:yes stop_codon:yes gene_type:complete
MDAGTFKNQQKVDALLYSAKHGVFALVEAKVKWQDAHHAYGQAKWYNKKAKREWDDWEDQAVVLVVAFASEPDEETIEDLEDMGVEVWWPGKSVAELFEFWG